MSYLAATADLLKVAHATLSASVMPLVDRETRYEAALVANALAIAVRELELGAQARATERRLLADLYGTPESTLADLRARLCRDLRAGAFGPARAEEVRMLLQQAVHWRLAISNPNYGGSAQAP